MSLVRPRALLFDLDGTLVDSIDDLAASANVARQELGLTPLAVEVIRGFIGDGARTLMTRVLADTDPADFERAFRRFRSHYGEHCLVHTRAYPGVEPTLASLAPLPLAVVSNKPQPFTEKVIRGLGLESAFEVVVGARPEVPVKPEPDLLRLALDQLGVPPERAWMVGDSLNDVRAGQAAGCPTVAVTYGLGDVDALTAAGPDALIDAFGDLLRLVESSL